MTYRIIMKSHRYSIKPQYFPQYKLLFIWWYFKDPTTVSVDTYLPIKFYSLEETQDWLDDKISNESIKNQTTVVAKFNR